MVRALVWLWFVASVAASANTIIPVDPDDYDRSAGAASLGDVLGALGLVVLCLAALLVVWFATAERRKRRLAREQGAGQLFDDWALKALWSAVVSVLALFPVALAVKWLGGADFVRESWLWWWAFGAAGFYWLRYG